MTYYTKYGIWKWHVTLVKHTSDTCETYTSNIDCHLFQGMHGLDRQGHPFQYRALLKWTSLPCVLHTLDDIHHTGTTKIVQQLKSGPTSFRSILTNYFLYKYIVWSHIFISLQSSLFSSPLLIACTTSVVPVRWLSLSVLSHHKKLYYALIRNLI